MTQLIIPMNILFIDCSSPTPIENYLKKNHFCTFVVLPNIHICINIFLNFFSSMNLEIVDSFGWDLGNGSFSGLTGQLQREECDFGGIGSFIRADRMTVVDYTVGTFYRQ